MWTFFFEHFKDLQSHSQPCWALKCQLYLWYNKTRFVSFEVCFCVKPTSSCSVQHHIQDSFTWSEYTQRIFTLNSELSLILSYLFSADATVDICLRSGCFWSCCTPCFPSVSLWSALWMTSTLVRSAALCSALWWAQFFFIYPRAQRAEQPCLDIQPCNSTKKHPFNTKSAILSTFIIMQQKK